MSELMDNAALELESLVPGINVSPSGQSASLYVTTPLLDSVDVDIRVSDHASVSGERKTARINIDFDYFLAIKKTCGCEYKCLCLGAELHGLEELAAYLRTIIAAFEARRDDLIACKDADGDIDDEEVQKIVSAIDEALA